MDERYSALEVVSSLHKVTCFSTSETSLQMNPVFAHVVTSIYVNYLKLFYIINLSLMT